MRVCQSLVQQVTRLGAVLAGVSLIAACQTPPDIQQLQNENTALQAQLIDAKNAIGELEADKVVLQQDMAELNRVIDVLGEEKDSRVSESTNLRGQARHFVQQQIDVLKEFLLASDLLDYIGGELVERSQTDEESLLVVDLDNAIPRDGTLTGIGGYFQSAGSVSVKVLRPVENDLVVVWSSDPVDVDAGGVHRIKFPVSVGVEQGDYLAYFFAQGGLVSFDTGTGDWRYSDNNIAVGNSIRRSSLKGGSEKRAYALGAFGLLNTH